MSFAEHFIDFGWMGPFFQSTKCQKSGQRLEGSYPLSANTFLGRGFEACQLFAEMYGVVCTCYRFGCQAVHYLGQP